MEVSSIEHSRSHAIIGGEKAMAFGISDSAEFYEILSATMYSDKPRAVVREVLCNAHDAHLMVGQHELRINVTISDVELIIQDFGPGIPKDKIHGIYCVYGNSTKTHDGVQTGGFGLGSKAPYAYSECFTVINKHDGSQTIYTASKGTPETDNKPDFRPMVTTHCGVDTGLTVKIPLKNKNDAKLFEKLVREIAFTGGIPVTLNGEDIEYIDYSKAKHGFICVSEYLFPSLQKSGFFVKYGSVIYPIDVNKDSGFEKLYSMKFFDNYAVILIAEPNSIGVTPSRESLSYTTKTISTLRDIVSKIPYNKNNFIRFMVKNGISLDDKIRAQLESRQVGREHSDMLVNTLLRAKYKFDLTKNSGENFISELAILYSHTKAADCPSVLITADEFAESFAFSMDTVDKIKKISLEDQLDIFTRKISGFHPKVRSIAETFISDHNNRNVNFLKRVYDLLHLRFRKLASFAEQKFGCKITIYHRGYNKWEPCEICDLCDANSVCFEYLGSVKDVNVVIGSAAKQYFNSKRGYKNVIFIKTKKSSDIEGIRKFLRKVGIHDFEEFQSQTNKHVAPKASAQLYVIGKDGMAIPMTNFPEFYICATEDEELTTATGSFVYSLFGINKKFAPLIASIFGGHVALSMNSTDTRKLVKGGCKNLLKHLCEVGMKGLEANNSVEVDEYSITDFFGYKVENWCGAFDMQRELRNLHRSLFESQYIHTVKTREQIEFDLAISIVSSLTGDGVKNGLQYLVPLRNAYKGKCRDLASSDVIDAAKNHFLLEVLRTIANSHTYRLIDAAKSDKNVLCGYDYHTMRAIIRMAIEAIPLRFKLYQMEKYNG